MLAGEPPFYVNAASGGSPLIKQAFQEASTVPSELQAHSEAQRHVPVVLFKTTMRNAVAPQAVVPIVASEA